MKECAIITLCLNSPVVLLIEIKKIVTYDRLQLCNFAFTRKVPTFCDPWI